MARRTKQQGRRFLLECHGTIQKLVVRQPLQVSEAMLRGLFPDVPADCADVPRFLSEHHRGDLVRLFEWVANAVAETGDPLSSEEDPKGKAEAVWDDHVDVGEFDGDVKRLILPPCSMEDAALQSWTEEVPAPDFVHAYVGGLAAAPAKAPAKAPANELAPTEAEGKLLRGDLLIAAEPLAKRGLLDPARLAEIQHGDGTLAADLAAIAKLYMDGWSKVEGRTPVEKKEVERAAKLGVALAKPA
jgi:hypothetical protein